MNSNSKLMPIIMAGLAFLAGCDESELRRESSSGLDFGPIQEPEGPPEEYQAIVVGSGFGGSVAALRLGETGVETLVLERGRWWRVEDPSREAGTFATLETVLGPGGDGRASWLSDVCIGNVYLTFMPPVECPVSTGILEYSDDQANPYDRGIRFRAEGIATVTAAGVGGGSLVYNGVTYLPSKAGWDAAFPSFDFPYMQDVWTELNDGGYFNLAFTSLAPEIMPEDFLDIPADGSPDYYESSRNQRDVSVAAGYPLDPSAPNYEFHGTGTLDVTYDWEKVREEKAGLRAPSVIAGEVWWGTNSGAKKTLDKPEGYLGRALATGSVEVRALHEVVRLEYDVHADRYRVTALHYDKDYRNHRKVIFTTPNLILSAGSIGTSKLLVSAKGRGDLPALNDYVGSHWSTNGNIFAFRKVVSTNDVVLQGGPAGFKTVVYDHSDSPIVMENLAHRAPARFAGSELTENLRKLNFTIGVGIPRGRGQFDYVAAEDTVRLRWPDDADINVLEAFRYVFSTLAPPDHRILLDNAQDGTVHPLGGVPLGLATDLHCRVAGYSGLYAIDGSVIPGPGALTNPSLLITAMSERCIDALKDEIHCRVTGC